MYIVACDCLPVLSARLPGQGTCRSSELSKTEAAATARALDILAQTPGTTGIVYSSPLGDSDSKMRQSMTTRPGGSGAADTYYVVVEIGAGALNRLIVVFCFADRPGCAG